MDGFDEAKAQRVEQRIRELQAMRASPATGPGAIARAFVGQVGSRIDQAIAEAQERAFVIDAHLRSTPPRNGA